MNKKAVTLIGLLAMITIIFLVGYYSISTNRNGVFSTLLKGDGELEIKPEKYQFKDDNGKLILGPYWINNDKYYIKEGKIYNSNWQLVKNSKIENLHNFYLHLRINPLFYSPYDNEDDINFSQFEDFSKDQFFYGKPFTNEIYPKQYYSELTKNIKATETFFEYPSVKNAGLLLGQNQKTLTAYASGLKNFILTIEEDGSGYDVPEVVKRNFFLYVNKDLSLVRLMTFDKVLELLTKFNNNVRSIQENIDYQKTILRGGARPAYNIEPSSPSLVEQTDFPDKTLMKKVFNQALYLNDDEYRIQDEEELRLYEINFQNKKALFYGIDNSEIYPNILLANYFRIVEFDDLEDNPEKYHIIFTATCEDPYIEEVRLKWYALDDFSQRVTEYKIYENMENFDNQKLAAVKEEGLRAEDNFLAYPSEDNLNYLASIYKKTFINLLESGSYAKDLTIIWKRFNLIYSKIYLLKRTFDDFYNENLFTRHYPQHMENLELQEGYYEAVLQDSLFFLTFMPWSKAVWFSPLLEEKDRYESIDRDSTRYLGDFMSVYWLHWQEFIDKYPLE